MGKVINLPQADNSKLVELVKKVREYDDEDAFRQLVKILHGYLQHLSTKKFFFIPGATSEDVYQEGLYALSTKAIPDYCEEKGAFLGFAKLCIKRHIITILKSASNNKNLTLNKAVSLYTSGQSNDDDGSVSIADLKPSDAESVVDTFIRSEAHQRLKALLVSKLTPLECAVLDLYLQNMSYMDIVSTMNKHRRGKNRIKSKVCDNALCRIKKKASEIEKEIGLNRNDLFEIDGA